MRIIGDLDYIRVMYLGDKGVVIDKFKVISKKTNNKVYNKYLIFILLYLSFK